MPRTRVQGLCPFQGSSGVLRKREVDGREGREGNSRRVLLEVQQLLGFTKKAQGQVENSVFAHAEKYKERIFENDRVEFKY